MIPLVDLSLQHQQIAEEVEEGFADLLSTGDFVGGKEVAAFEQEYAQFIGARACVGVGNGTDALEMALRAVGVGPDDEVVLPANTFIATAEAVIRAGARPVLVDVDDAALMMDPTAVEDALTEHTRAVIPVDLYGQIAPFDQLPASLAERGVAVIEDAAQSHGATRHGKRAGSFGVAAGTSFYPGKNLGAYGDGGAVTTDDEELATRVRLLGAHGSATKYEHTHVGFNSRLDTIQAVVLRAKLRRLHHWNAERREAGALYERLLEGTPGLRLPVVLPGNDAVLHLYVVRIESRRDEVLDRMRGQGVGASVHYPVPLHLTPALRQYGHGPGSLPVCERAAGELLSLPIFPGITQGQQERVTQSLRDALASGGD
jgi:dTDP-4-amino-4,6-dideoxygalactose transaminase